MARHNFRWKHQPRRSSRRLDGWAPAGNTECASTKPFFLPYELLTDIISRLDKKTLKAARLTCKDWKQLTTPLLFDRIWVSPRTKDMDVFTNITENPDLAVHVGEIRYDQTSFEPVDDLEEFMSVLLDKNSRLVSNLKPRAQSHPGFSLGQCADAVYRPNWQPLEEAVDRFNLRGFMEEAYIAWRHMVKNEAILLNSYSYFEQLINGFALLPDLYSLVLDEQMWWNTMGEFALVSEKQFLACDISGSPLARSWHPFYLRPLHEPEGTERSGQGFKILMHALANAGKTIMSFDSGGIECLRPKFPSSWLQPPLARSLSSSSQAVLSQLRILSLKLQMQEDDNLEAPSTLGYLPLVLQQARLLRRLRLNLNPHQQPTDLPPKRIKFGHIFDHGITYPFLRDYSLAGIEFDTLIFHIFLIQRCKRIRRLELRNITLLSGCWGTMIQSLRYIQQLELVNLTLCYLKSFGTFHHRNGQLSAVGTLTRDNMLWNEDSIMDERINAYILFGGRHPCLSDGDPEAQEWEWLLNSLPKEFQENVQPLLLQNLREHRQVTAEESSKIS